MNIEAMQYLCYKIVDDIIVVQVFENFYNRSDFMRRNPEYLLIGSVSLTGHPKENKGTLMMMNKL